MMPRRLPETRLSFQFAPVGLTNRAARVAVLILALPVVLGACASVPAARIALPDSLAGAVREDRVAVGFGRDGQASLDGGTLTLRRGADRLELFRRVFRDKGSLSYTWALPATAQRPAGEVRADCRARRTELTAGIVAVTASPWTLTCDMAGAGSAWGQPSTAGRLMAVERSTASGTQDRLEGQYEVGDVTVRLESVHRFAGSGWPSRRPVGVVAMHQGRAVAAVALTDTEPVLIRAVGGSNEATRAIDAATQALLAVALMWDPGSAD